MGAATVAVGIPTIEGREHLLTRVLESVQEQTRSPDMLIIYPDLNRAGPAASRNAILDQVTTDYVAWVDDDDELMPNHLEVTMRAAEENGADLIYPWFRRNDGMDIFRVDNRFVFQRPWDDRLRRAILEENNFIPITTLIRTETLRSVGGFPLPWVADWPHPANEDWGCWKRLLRAGATFHHVPEITWWWHPHGVDRRSVRITT